MPTSEAQKAANRRYKATHEDSRKLVSCRAPAETAEAFKQKCAEQGTTPNAVLIDYINEYIGDAKC